MATTFLNLYQYAQHKLGGRSDSNAIVVAKRCVNDAVRYLAERDHQYYRTRAYINLLAPFTSGTVTVAAGATYCSLSSGGTWSSSYSGGMIRIGSDKVAYEATISSNAARITFGASATYGYASQTSATYSLYKFKYALPTDFRKIGDVLDEVNLANVEWLDDLNEFERYRLQNYADSGSIDRACVAGGYVMIWPYPTSKQVVPLPYYRFPVDMALDAATLDYPDTGGNLVLVRRAIDYMCAMEEGDDEKSEACLARLGMQEGRTEAYKRGRSGIIELGPAAYGTRRVTKIVGSDD